MPESADIYGIMIVREGGNTTPPKEVEMISYELAKEIVKKEVALAEQASRESCGGKVEYSFVAGWLQQALVQEVSYGRLREKAVVEG